MSKDITLAELHIESVELLPERAALSTWANVLATNSAMALNAATIHSFAKAGAFQSIHIH